MAEKEKKGGGGSKIIIILLAAILICGIGFGAYYILVLSKQNAVHVEENPYKDSVTYSLDEFRINLADKNTKILKLKLDVVYKKNSKLDEELKTKHAILRDRVIAIIRTKTEDELNRDANLEKFKSQILEAINPILEEGKVEEVVAQDYLIA